MQRDILVVNAGSHSLQVSVLGPDDEVRAAEQVDAAPDGPEAHAALARILDSAPDLAAVGHRIVHGGPHLDRPRIVDDEVRRHLDAAANLAPLHVPPALAALDECRRRLPGVPQVACVDTAFHAEMPDAARTYAIPREWRERYGVRRYGFHGLSYGWAMRRAAELLGRPPGELSMVLAHLGGGASVCAVHSGQSVWTSMGFTPLEGLIMVSRSGSVDPGMLLWLQTEHGMTAAEITDALHHHSGLLGLSDGFSGDTRDLVRAAAEGDEVSDLALRTYALRAHQEMAAAASCLPRLDAVVFTGEIGADQPELRDAIGAGLRLLGVRTPLDPRQDEDRIVSTAGVPVLLVHPREDRQIAAEVRAVIG